MPIGMAINERVMEMEYAVRGPIAQRAAELRKAGRRTIPCNIGNPQALGQRPITFYRQVLSLLELPSRIGLERRWREFCLRDPGIARELGGEELIPEYVLDYCERLLGGLETGLGAYTESKGPLFIRQAVARYIDRRDGVGEGRGRPADPESIFLTDGASEGAKNVLEVLIGDRRDGIMIPIPQYPLYSATITRCGGRAVGYYPDEERGWALDRQTLEEPLAAARREGVCVKAVVVINPANPTGAILDRGNVREVIHFARDNGLAIIADEVYQENLYGAEFVSFARALGGEEVPLFSLHSASKGFYGECGQRGGYLEVRNPPRVVNRQIEFMAVLNKQASVNLCSNTVGQALIYLLASPPETGSPSYARFLEEKEQVLRDLYEKGTMVRQAFREMEGVECFGRIGAMYLFPRLGRLPAGKGDFDYCMSLLEETGLTTVNGSGFGQQEGTAHLRIAFLPPRTLLAEVLPEWIRFHNRFVGRG